MNGPDREARDAAMKAPDWHYQAPFRCEGVPASLYRKVELMAAPGDLGLTLRRRDGSDRASLQTSLFIAQGTVMQETYLTPQRAIALRDALNDYLADVRKEALG